MILLDTNVLIDARMSQSPFFDWAENVMIDALAGEGAAVNAIVLAELCVGQTDPDSIEADLRKREFHLVDVPAAAAPICARAYSAYCKARLQSRGGKPARTPLPDFFIGAHAELMGWTIASRDFQRLDLYFPRVKLIRP